MPNVFNQKLIEFQPKTTKTFTIVSLIYVVDQSESLKVYITETNRVHNGLESFHWNISYASVFSYENFEKFTNSSKLRKNLFSVLFQKLFLPIV